jgi:hypothetical protein
MDDPARIGQLERELAGLTPRVSALEAQVRELFPLTTGLVRLEGSLNVVKQDVYEIKKEQHERTEQERSLRIALIGLSGTILVTLIGAIVTILLVYNG